MSSKGKSPAATRDESALVPKLRFPEFQGADGWETAPGDELFQQVNNREAPTGLPILAITQEHGAIPRHMIDYHVSVTEKSLETYKEVRPGDFIISLRSFQGGIEFSDYHGICSPAYVILRKRGRLSDVFYRQYFKSHDFIQQLTRNLEGLRDGKMISYKQFSELQLLTPTLPEQQKIADCLNSADELIAAQGRKVEALRAHKKGLMQRLFPQEGETQPRLRFPEFRDAMPWEACTIESQCTAKISYGIVQAGPNVPDGMPYIKSTDLNSELCLARLSRTSGEIAKKYRRSEVVPGDLVFSLRGNIGVSQIVPEEIPVANLTQGTARIRTRGPSAFYLVALQSQPVMVRILAVSKGSTFQEISLEALREVTLSCPGIGEQQRIADCLTSLDDLIAVENQKLGTLKTHKKGLMQQIFPQVGGG
jgi:type I restriction enzyme S subunit